MVSWTPLVLVYALPSMKILNEEWKLLCKIEEEKVSSKINSCFGLFFLGLGLVNFSFLLSFFSVAVVCFFLPWCIVAPFFWIIGWFFTSLIGAHLSIKNCFPLVWII